MSKTKQQDTGYSGKHWFKQFKELLPVMGAIYAPILMLLTIISLQTRIPIRHLTRDPLAIVGEPFYFGAISNLGNLLWCSTVAVCFFSFALLRKLANCRKIRHLQQFLFFSACVTFILLLDDLFLIHEEVFPNYLNISEDLLVFGYGAIFVLYLVKFRKIILKTDFLLLIVALGFFGISVSLDLFIPGDWLNWERELVLEDGSKLLGIMSWLAYFSRVCIGQLKQIMASPP
jgi:hypothetical protein